MTCTSPSRGVSPALRAHARHRCFPTAAAAIAFILVFWAASFAPEAHAQPKPLRTDDGSLLRVVDSVHASIGQSVGRGERRDYARSGEILEIDAPSYPGSTGGAVLNEEGDWVAVVVGRAVPSPSNEGSRVGLNRGDDPVPDPNGVLIALPVDQVAWMTKELETYGSVRRGYLGIQLRRTTGAASESLGVLVAGVVPASPADSAGIRVGDRVLAIEGEEAHTADALTAKVRSTRPGDQIELTVLRGTEIFPMRVTVGAAFA